MFETMKNKFRNWLMNPEPNSQVSTVPVEKVPLEQVVRQNILEDLQKLEALERTQRIEAKRKEANHDIAGAEALKAEAEKIKRLRFQREKEWSCKQLMEVAGPLLENLPERVIMPAYELDPEVEAFAFDNLNEDVYAPYYETASEAMYSHTAKGEIEYD